MAVWIGLDTGEHTGLAVWDGSARTFRVVATLPLWKALEEVKRWQYACLMQGVPLVVIFEDARKRKWLPRERNVAEYRGRLMGAGSVKRDATIWEEALTAWGVPFQAVAPAAGRTKWNPDYWAKVTGWTGRTSEHARDASLLVFGRR